MTRDSNGGVDLLGGDFYHPHHPQAFRNHQYLLVVGILSPHHRGYPCSSLCPHL